MAHVSFWIDEEAQGAWWKRSRYFIRSEFGSIGPYRTKTEAEEWLAVVNDHTGWLALAKME